MINKLTKKYKRYTKEPIILIYQMGKVGSSSIHYTLNKLNFNILHVHTFDGIDVSNMYVDKERVEFFYNAWYRIKAKVLMRIKLLLIKRNPNIKIISLVREPYSMLMSRYFQDLHLVMKPLFDKGVIFQSHEEFMTLLADDFEKSINLDYFNNWFDLEINRNFDIDVYSLEVNADRKFVLGKSQYAKLLLLNLEQLSKCESIIGDFIGVKDFHLVSSNESKNKWYSQFYKEFRNDYTPSKELKEAVENTKFYKKFFNY